MRYYQSIYPEMDKIMHECRLKLCKLVFTKHGYIKAGITKRQFRRYIRTQHQMKMIQSTRAEGNYEPIKGGMND